MSLRRGMAVFALEVTGAARRPIFWILLLVMGLLAFGLSQGNVRIQAGDTAVGGTKAWITSEFANAYVLSVATFIFYSFFIAVVAGMSVIRDDELKVGDLIHATPLRPGEYVWGKFLGLLAAFLAVLLLHLAASMLFNHALPNAKAEEFRGPLGLVNYLRPALLFALPTLVFVAGTTFAVGERTRRPILVFVLPLAALAACGFFLWTWAPSWLDPRWDRLLMLVDPAGFRWLNGTWLKVDRGVDFYNRARMPVDALFVVNRLAVFAVGCAAVFAAQRHFAATVRGRAPARGGPQMAKGAAGAPAGFAAPAGAAPGESLARGATREEPESLGFGRRLRVPGFLAGMREVASVELRELRSQPGLYLFIPLILLQVLGTSLTATGAFDTKVLLTPGTIAVRTMNTLTLLVCFLLLFYTVESLVRERVQGLAPITYTTPVRTAALLFGKAAANCVVGIVVALATFLACAIALLVQGRVGLDLGPFLLVWGLLLVPTFLLWSSFVMALFAATGSRYTTYGLALAALLLTGYLQLRGKVSWVGNWDLWSVLTWSDMGTFEVDRTALWLNRLLALALTVLFTVLAVRLFPRGEFDPTRVVHRSSPGALCAETWRLAPFLALPLLLGIALAVQVNQGFQGDGVKKRHKDYWKQNVGTWREAPAPVLAGADLDLTLEPARRWFRTEGSYQLVNLHATPLSRVALTGGDHWEKISWTLDGEEVKPDDRSRLFVFTPPRPLAPGDTLRIGFRFEGRYPRGISRNGGSVPEFILPSGVVLTSFRPSFAPVVGYDEEIGVEEENRFEPRVYADDFYHGMTEAAFGAGVAARTHIRITAPAAYTLNSVGTKVSDEVREGRRTVVWVSDHPVNFFNVVAGRWDVRPGENTAVYYHPGHEVNVAEMSAALDAARRYYSEWFLTFPWQELKLSEFPDLARYAQGFPTNITFSEGIGFLAKSDPKSDPAFVITAHEAAHQWWGNLLVPGKGPGGDILSEGMSHFSTMLLLEQVKGEGARMEFAKRIESDYGDHRQVDAERPLVKIDESRPGDNTVTYDKGGWVFWMLLRHMGREAGMAGYRNFIAEWSRSEDHPVLQDFVASMRPFASDTTAYDDFVKQWFYEVHVPEYRLAEAKKARLEGGAAAADSAAASPTWEVSVHVENVGGGRMPVEVAAARGERFGKDGSPSSDYADARVTVILGDKEAQEVKIRCAFEPERVVVDPDVLVLQLRRKNAVARL